MAGDLNTSITTVTSAVGLTTYLADGQRVKGPKARNEPILTALLKQHDLAMLNTWDHKAGPTFSNDNSSSRADFLCARRIHTVGLAKQARLLIQMPLVPESGPPHFPLVTTPRKQWHIHLSDDSKNWLDCRPQEPAASSWDGRKLNLAINPADSGTALG